MKDEETIRFFSDQAKLFSWFEKNHTKAKVLWIGYHKVSTGKDSINWSESVDVALCFGWIDGVRKSIDEVSYKIRFTPRKASSNWSAINIKKMKTLIETGQMRAPGLEAFNNRDDAKSNQYSYERETAKLTKEFEAQFRKNKKAWDYFQSQPPWYRKAASWWVISAKQDATQLKRLNILIGDSMEGKRIALLTNSKK
ncbi:bacteriocin-protection protein [Leptospira perolatii]|uniref:Bacteriocin-protection protein n=1 Tax=Leptospira perolatii TaxID=2023191 RepID=A0A2M9ZIB9_9LEPT|nr:YdeI/OmpD-associated family protein [Leptospira perolatii]PJZ69097.1 bacteriocin-protection protein [Leptospira perolatii]PJZ71806.1 bacteriocin-protection protein [Leptospira perolatii]